MELVKAKSRLDVEVVESATSVAGTSQVYKRPDAQSVETVSAVQDGTVYVREVPSRSAAWAVVTGAVTSLIAVHASRIVKSTDPDSPLIADPSGDVAVIAIE